jgi:Tfp pilus assembly protein PilW
MFRTRVSSLSDDGFTLIELLVYISLSTIVLFIIGGFMISSLRTERDVTSTAEGTTAGQLIFTSIQAAVRNASGMRVETASNGDQMLVALTNPGGAANPVCQAWFYSAATRAVYTRASKTPAAAIAWPTTSPAGSWTLLGSGVKPIGTGKIVFSPAGPAPTSARVLGPNSDSVSLTLEVSAGARAPVRLETTVYSRVKPIVGAPCFP